LRLVAIYSRCLVATGLFIEPRVYISGGLGTGRNLPNPTLALENVRIVLVETSHPGNIGGAARAMKTMGLSQLWLVRPQRYPDPQAEWRAAGALDVLDAAVVVDTLDAALADCGLVVGTSTRQRRIPWPAVNPRELAARIAGEAGARPTALLFGREASGLNNDELQRCHLHLQIPANPAYPSLNVAMAVQVVCYELYQGRDLVPGADAAVAWDRPPATVAAVDAFYTHLQTLLERIEFIEADNPGQVMTRLKRLFARVRLDETEVAMLRGMLSEIERALPPRPHTGPK
jgi:tRNA (cytidine32/uridine32-2'-O)-methyltransferase